MAVVLASRVFSPSGSPPWPVLAFSTVCLICTGALPESGRQAPKPWRALRTCWVLGRFFAVFAEVVSRTVVLCADFGGFWVKSCERTAPSGSAPAFLSG